MQTEERLIRAREVRSLTGLSPSAMHRLIHAGMFPKPLELVPGGRSVAYRLTEVRAWVAERISAARTGGAA